MANGKIIEEIRRLIEGENKIPATVRDRLMLAALADIYDRMEGIDKLKLSVEKMEPWIAGIKWLSLIVGALIVVLVWSMVTHTFAWPF